MEISLYEERTEQETYSSELIFISPPHVENL